MLSLPPRAIRRFCTASVMVPIAVEPFGITIASPRVTSSRVSKSTLSFTWASADETVLFILIRTGVPSDRIDLLTVGGALVALWGTETVTWVEDCSGGCLRLSLNNKGRDKCCD